MERVGKITVVKKKKRKSKNKCIHIYNLKTYNNEENIREKVITRSKIRKR